jgi:hypothetical protein
MVYSIIANSTTAESSRAWRTLPMLRRTEVSQQTVGLGHQPPRRFVVVAA